MDAPTSSDEIATLRQIVANLTLELEALKQEQQQQQTAGQPASSQAPGGHDAETADKSRQALKDRRRQLERDRRIEALIDDGTLFKDICTTALGTRTYFLWDETSKSPGMTYRLARALCDASNEAFLQLDVLPEEMTADNFEDVCMRVDDMAWRLEEFRPRQPEPKAEAVAAPAARKGQRHRRRRGPKRQDDPDASNSYTIGGIGIAPRAEDSSSGRQGGRLSHLPLLPGLLCRGKEIRGRAYQGAQVSLITIAAAQRLGVHVSTSSRPTLSPLWPTAEPYVSRGRARIRLRIPAERRAAWVRPVVVDFGDECWDVLVGADVLGRLQTSM
ncbi:hypothetical protein H4R18_002926 [Coemansia javaensis]|uniref:Uncharacterized protein n=1 Tax=Coemansia javaensis TaxID=2761396 RepID=A0A9W8HAP2_9FUNG|nr:hypothetical protein H4R18_002926 [Coemansia javaensis]